MTNLIAEELKLFRMAKINKQLDEDGIIEFTPSNGGVKLMGDDPSLIFAIAVIDYQTECKDFRKGSDIQLLDSCGDVFDIKAKGPIIIVSDYDVYLNMLEDFNQ